MRRNYKTERRFLWCGDRLCQERTSADVVKSRFFEEGQDNAQLGTFKTYYTRDHLGSVRSQVNYYPNNTLEQSYFDYNAYGKPTFSQLAGSVTPTFRYAGMFYLSDAGLYLTHYRAYDPNNARWLNRDPIGEQGGINLYAYVGGNPVNYTDSLGLVVDPDPVGGMAFGRWVHDVFSREIVTPQGLIPNKTNDGLFNKYRPDAYDPIFSEIFELKPATCIEGPGRKKAENQLQKYAEAGSHNGEGKGGPVFLGDQYRLVPKPIVFDGIEFFPDTKPSSGLNFYRPTECGCPK
jgi:RHS repeat-associated protein